MHCVKFRRREITDRHDDLAKFFYSCLYEFGFDCELEKTLGNRRQGTPRLRPDLDFILDTRYLLDVSVAHPSSPSLVVVAQHGLGAASQREQAKTAKYRGLAEREDSQFVPFVLESTGAFGNELSWLIDSISKSPSIRGEFRYASPSAIKGFISRAISISLQKGNARILREGVRRCGPPSRPVRMQHDAE